MNKDKLWVFEVIHVGWPEWEGNQLYDALDYAKFCAEQDYLKAFPHEDMMSWEVLMKATYTMYVHREDDIYPTDIEIRVRHVNSLDK
jgi:hypothetical protein